MKTLEIILEEESKIPFEVVRLVVTNRNFYFLSEEDPDTNMDTDGFPQSFSIHKKKDLYHKKVFLIKGDWEIALALNDHIIFLDEVYINQFDGFNLKRYPPEALSGQPYFEFLDIGTDGHYLYIASEKSQEMLKFNPFSDEPIQRIYCNTRNVPKFISSDNGFFIGGEEDDRNYCRRFFNGKEGSRIEIKNSKSERESFDEKIDLFYTSYLPQGDYKRSNQKRIGDEIKIIKPSPVYFFSGGGILYVLMNNGEVWVPTEEKTINLGGEWNNEFEEGGAVSNSSYTILFNNNKAGIFRDKKQVGESSLQIHTEDILSLGADEKYIYVLMEGDILQKYEIIKS